MINLCCLKLQVTLYYKVKVGKISAYWDNEDQEQNGNNSNLIDKGNWPHSVRLGKSEVSKKKKKRKRKLWKPRMRNRHHYGL